MQLLLDTHTFLWAVSGDDRLSKNACVAFQNAKRLFLSSISSWEINTKYNAGKLPLPEQPSLYIPKQRTKHQIETLAFTEADTFQLSKLPLIHKDPFDRMLIAQAIANNLTILTADSAITQYPIATLW